MKGLQILLLFLVIILTPTKIFSQAFITTWETSNTGVGTSGNAQITIPTHPGSVYDYNVFWGDGSADLNVTGDIIHTYTTTGAGTYTVTITGTFPRIYFNGVGDGDKILSIEQWGANKWESFELAFSGCSNLVINATDAPDLRDVTDMRLMFQSASSLSGDLSGWDVSNVTNMLGTFSGTGTFTTDFSRWDVSSVTNMRSMFSNTSSGSDLSSWDVSNVTDMSRMFANATEFNSSMNSWDVSNVTTMARMFSNATFFTRDLSAWDVSSVTDMSEMFQFTQAFGSSGFPNDLSGWDVSNVTDMSQMFDNAAFDSDVSTWDVSNVTNMDRMFAETTRFNQDISSWDVGNVTTMQNMFKGTILFNADLSTWDVSSVSDMSGMFEDAQTFNGDLNSWDVSNVTDMVAIFRGTESFNRDVSNWDVSGITSMIGMFANTTVFNQDLSNWNVSSVTLMGTMFLDATAFNQDLGTWDVSSVTSMVNMLDNSGISQANYENSLIGWASASFLQPNVTLGASGMEYCKAEGARLVLMNDYAWNIVGDEEECTEVCWNGTSWIPSSGPTTRLDAVLNADYDVAEHGGFETINLTISSGVTLTLSDEAEVDIEYDLTNYGTIIINDETTLYLAEGFLINNGTITIESGSSLLTNSGNISGNDITYKRNTRYADGRYSFVGSPMEQNAGVTDATLGSHVYYYDETEPYATNEGLDRWDAMSGELVPGQGYTQAGQQEIIFTGIPNTRTVRYFGTYTEDTDDANEGWNLVANPYLAAMRVQDVISINDNLIGAIYIWDDNGSGGIRGTNADYIVANGTVATNTTPAGGQTRYNGHLGAAQGFFVKLRDNTDLEIEFSDDMLALSGNNADANFFRTEEIPLARVNLTNDAGLFKQCVLMLSEDADPQQLKRHYDAQAFNANSKDGLFMLKAGRSLAINAMPQDWQSVQLQLNVEAAGTYEISVEREYYQRSTYLRDNFTNEVIDISEQTHSFESEAGIYFDRFEMLSSPYALLDIAEELVEIYVFEKMLFIESPNTQRMEFQLFNLSGKYIDTFSIVDQRSIDLSHLPDGIYVLFDGAKSQKVVLK